MTTTPMRVLAVDAVERRQGGEPPARAAREASDGDRRRHRCGASAAPSSPSSIARGGWSARWGPPPRRDGPRWTPQLPRPNRGPYRTRRRHASFPEDGFGSIEDAALHAGPTCCAAPCRRSSSTTMTTTCRSPGSPAAQTLHGAELRRPPPRRGGFRRCGDARRPSRRHAMGAGAVPPLPRSVSGAQRVRELPAHPALPRRTGTSAAPRSAWCRPRARPHARRDGRGHLRARAPGRARRRGRPGRGGSGAGLACAVATERSVRCESASGANAGSRPVRPDRCQVHIRTKACALPGWRSAPVERGHDRVTQERFYRCSAAPRARRARRRRRAPGVAEEVGPSSTTSRSWASSEPVHGRGASGHELVFVFSRDPDPSFGRTCRRARRARRAAPRDRVGVGGRAPDTGVHYPDGLLDLLRAQAG